MHNEISTKTPHKIQFSHEKAQCAGHINDTQTLRTEAALKKSTV